MASPAPDAASPVLSLQVLACEIGVGVYDYDKFLTLLAQCGRKALVRLDERDVERCLVEPWPSSSQVLALTPAASKRWTAVEAARPKRDDGSPGALLNHAFEVDLRGQRLFAGITYFAAGAAAIRYPILMPEHRDGSVILCLRSSLVDDVYFPLTPEQRDEQRRRIDQTAVREVFRNRGVLEEYEQIDFWSPLPSPPTSKTDAAK